MAKEKAIWDGRSIGKGPIMLSATPSSAGAEEVVLLAQSSPSGPVAIKLQKIKEFFDVHVGEQFLSLDVCKVHRRILTAHDQQPGAAVAQESLCALTSRGNWIDLRLLDRQVRQTRQSRLRRWSEIAADWLQEGEGTSIVKNQDPRGDNNNSARRAEFSEIMQVYGNLISEAESLATEARPIPPPVFEQSPVSPEKEALEEKRSRAHIKRILEHRKKRGLDRSEVAPVPRLERSQKTIVPEPEPAPLGHKVEVWAAVCLPPSRQTGLTVDPNQILAFLTKTEEEYLKASKILFQQPESQDCFEWDGARVARDDKSYPVVKPTALAGWLRGKIKGLCDAQNQAPDVPLDARGRPPTDPELWGFWVACDDALWAWRQEYRMAEMARIVGLEMVAHPRYETTPMLRSMEPNLAVYRALRIPVFRARDGYVFVTGKLLDLPARCLAAVCIWRGYTLSGHARLYQYVLRQDSPIRVAAGELYTAAVIGPKREKGAQDYFDELRTADLQKHSYWLRLTSALLETAPLGLPGSFHRKILQNDYGFDDLGESRISEYVWLLGDHVAYELRHFLKDPTIDVVSSRLGLTLQKGLGEFVDLDDPDTSAAKLRNDLKHGHERAPVNKLLRQRDQVSPAGSPSQGQGGAQELFRYRALTLGGRITRKGASAAVRRQEFLMAAEEVMLVVGHDLCAAGYQLLGLAGNEFVLEVRQNMAGAEHLERIRQVAREASRRILGDMAGPVELEGVPDW